MMNVNIKRNIRKFCSPNYFLLLRRNIITTKDTQALQQPQNRGPIGCDFCHIKSQYDETSSKSQQTSILSAMNHFM